MAIDQTTGARAAASARHWRGAAHAGAAELVSGYRVDPDAVAAVIVGRWFDQLRMLDEPVDAPAPPA